MKCQEKKDEEKINFCFSFNLLKTVSMFKISDGYSLQDLQGYFAVQWLYERKCIPASYPTYDFHWQTLLSLGNIKGNP